VTPDSGEELPAPGRSPSASAREPWREWMESKLAAGRNAKAIWQELVDDHSFQASYQSVKRFVNKLQEASRAKRAPSSKQRRVRKRRLIMATARWCATRTRASTAVPDYSFLRLDTAVSQFGC
jgi:transposase